MLRLSVTVLVCLALVVGGLADAVTVEAVKDHPEQEARLHEQHQMTTKRFTVYYPTSEGGVGMATGNPAITGKVACKNEAAAPKAGVCHQAGLSTQLAAHESGQQSIQVFVCEISQGGCTLGQGQLHGLGLAPSGVVTGKSHTGSSKRSALYPITFSIIGGTGAYANVIGGSTTFSADSGLTFNLRVAK